MNKNGAKFEKISFVNAEELLDNVYEPVDMLIEDILGRGVYLFAGAPKIGKSWLVLWLAHVVSQGQPLWNFKTKQCEVLYMCLEDPYARVQARLAKLTSGEASNIHFTNESGLLEYGLEWQLETYLQEHPQTRLIIMDTFQKVRKFRRDQDCYGGDYEALNSLKSIADKYNITILLVHHTRKKPSLNPFDGILGSRGLMGSVDGALVLVRDDPMQRQAQLYVTGREIIDTELELNFNLETAKWDFVRSVGEKREEKRNELMEMVSRFVEEHGEFHGTATELYESLTKMGELQPRSPGALTGMLNPLAQYLLENHRIRYETQRSAKQRLVHLVKEAEQEETEEDVSVTGDIGVIE